MNTLLLFQIIAKCGNIPDFPSEENAQFFSILIIKVPKQTCWFISHFLMCKSLYRALLSILTHIKKEWYLPTLYNKGKTHFHSGTLFRYLCLYWAAWAALWKWVRPELPYIYDSRNTGPWRGHLHMWKQRHSKHKLSSEQPIRAIIIKWRWLGPQGLMSLKPHTLWCTYTCT